MKDVRVDPPRPGGSTSDGIHVYVSSRALTAIAAVLLVCLGTVWMIRRNPGGREIVPGGAQPSPSAPAISTPQFVSSSAPGPWGELDYIKISIERPDEFIDADPPAGSITRWFFQKETPAQLDELFQSSGLDETDRKRLLNTNSWVRTTNGFFIIPGKDLVLGMSAETRAKIYSVLAEYPTNVQHSGVVARPSHGWADWFRDSGLSQETLQQVSRLLYKRGTAICLADSRDLLASIPSPEEKHRLLKAISRQFTMLVKLRIRPDTDIEALARYWGKEGRAKDIKPLLESLKRVPGGATIDLAHLMSHFARHRLYTYPFPSDDPSEPRHNCFFTAMNYFLEEPDNRFCDVEYTRNVLQSEYYPLPNNDPSYGDLIFLYDHTGTPIHAAVYIAAEIVFTKNGANHYQPWILMEFEDMLALYQSDKPVRTVAYRRKRS